MDQNVLKMLYEQIAHELHNSSIYIGMAGWAEYVGLEGFGKWLMKQGMDERGHADLIINYLIQRGKSIFIPSVPAISGETWNSISAVMAAASDTEITTTEKLQAIYNAAEGKGDHMTMFFLQPMIVEQVEEEDVTSTLRDRVEMAGKDMAALLVLDHQLME